MSTHTLFVLFSTIAENDKLAKEFFIVQKFDNIAKFSPDVK